MTSQRPKHHLQGTYITKRFFEIIDLMHALLIHI